MPRFITRIRSISLCCVGFICIFADDLALGQSASTGNLNQLLQNSYQALQRSDWEGARQAAIQATAIDPKNQLAWSYLGRAYDNLPNLAKAVEAWQTVITLNPRHSFAYNNLGWSYRRLGRVDDAIASYRQQLEVSPRNSYATYNLAVALGSLGRWEEALQFATQASAIAPTEVSRWNYLGKTQMRTGHLDEARGSFDRALTLPHRPMDENNIAYALAEAGVDLDKSWRLITGALESTTRQMCEPDALSDADLCTEKLRSLPLMLDTAGWVLFKQGKIKEAGPYLESAFAITPNSVNQIHLAIVRAKEGHLEEAVRMFAGAHVRADFTRADSEEGVRELAQAAGGEKKLEAMLGRAKVEGTPRVDARAVVLADASGKILDSLIEGPAAPGVAGLLNSTKLPALSWPGFALRTIRSIEFMNQEGRWVASDSYVGLTPPPPPCSTPTRMIEITRTTPVSQSVSCSSAF